MVVVAVVVVAAAVVVVVVVVVVAAVVVVTSFLPLGEQRRAERERAQQCTDLAPLAHRPPRHVDARVCAAAHLARKCV